MTTPPQDLVGQLVDVLREREALDNQRWGMKRLHPSDLGAAIPGSGCLRQIWLRTRGAESRPKTVGELLMLENANAIHERVEEAAAVGLNLPGELEIEVEVEFYGVTGRADIVCTDNYTKRRTVVDIKTVRSGAFQWLDAPKPSHVLQVQHYMAGIGAQDGYLIYIDREGSNTPRQFRVQRDDEAVIGAIRTCSEAIAATEAPPILDMEVKLKDMAKVVRINAQRPWQCNYCHFRGVSCEGAGPEIVQIGEINKATKRLILTEPPTGYEKLAEAAGIEWMRRQPGAQDQLTGEFRED